jgi:hypothetical protein
VTKRDWIIIALIIFCWGAEYLYMIAPRKVILEWIITDAELSYRWYIFELTNFARFIIFAVCLLIRPEKLHFITKDVLIINIIMMSFSLVWFIAFYHNPFSLSVAWIKIIATIIIYISIFSIRWHGKRNGKLFNRGDICNDI